MPIKPENKNRYPTDWPALSLAAKERARWRCEHPGCRAAQYSVGRWVCFAGGPHEWRPLEGNSPPKTAQDHEFDNAGEGCNFMGDSWTYKAARDFIARWCWEEGERPIVIVLTVAHLDHQPENCAPENLRAWCQRHHLAYDAGHHRVNAQVTRRLRGGTMELFPC